MTDKNTLAFPNYFTEELISSIKLMSLKKGEHLFHTDDTVEGIYYVLKGEIKAIRNMLKGTESVMTRSQKGDFFGESALAIENYICDAVCSKSVQVAFLSKSSFITAMKNSDFALEFSLSLAKSIRRQCSRCERLRLNKAKERLLHYLICESNNKWQLTWHSPLIELAGELAIEPETLYRVLSELENEGSIERDKKKIKLLPINFKT